METVKFQQQTEVDEPRRYYSDENSTVNNREKYLYIYANMRIFVVLINENKAIYENFESHYHNY